MLSAIALVGIPSAVGLAGFLCYRQGREEGYAQGWEDGNHYPPLADADRVLDYPYDQEVEK